jgi:hypothetical protein
MITKVKTKPAGKGSAGSACQQQPTREAERATWKRRTRNKAFNWLRKLPDIYDLTYRHPQGTGARNSEAYESYALRAERDAESNLAYAVFI